MADGKPASTANEELAIRYQERFEYYILALTFTILALAVETANESFAWLIGLAEIAAWFALLVSGLLGLNRLVNGASWNRSLASMS